MKNYVYLFAVLAIASCAKKSTPSPAPITPSTSAHFIPNWISGDTLYAMLLDSANHWTGAYDTMFTKKVNDTSFIIYAGKQYYIWKEPLTANDTFEFNQLQYNNVVISSTINIQGALSYSPLNAALPYKYKDQQGNWSYQLQSVMVNDGKNFKKTNSLYRSNKQY